MAAAAHIPEFEAGDKTGIEALLHRFSTESKQLARERRQLEDDPARRLLALLREIDETVLPRRLDLQIAGISVAQLVVSNRRLVSVNLTDDAVPKDDLLAVAAHFARCLEKIAGSTGRLSIVINHHPERSTDHEVTCSVDALKAYLGLGKDHNAFEELTDMVEALAIAQLSWAAGSTSSDFKGTTDWRDLLEGSVRKYQAREKSRRTDAKFEPDETEGVAIPVTTQEILVIAGFAGAGIAAIMPRDAGLKTVCTWQIAASSPKG